MFILTLRLWQSTSDDDTTITAVVGTVFLGLYKINITSRIKRGNSWFCIDMPSFGEPK